MDEKDKKIIEMLKINSRTPLSKIAKELKISKTAVKKRFEKLKNKEIASFTISLKKEKEAAIGVNIEKEKYFEIIDTLKKQPFVESIYLCSGNHDLFVYVKEENIKKSKEALKKIKGVKELCYNIILKKVI